MALKSNVAFKIGQYKNQVLYINFNVYILEQALRSYEGVDDIVISHDTQVSVIREVILSFG